MRELAARPEVAHVLIFENKGEAVGVSNPHPHCQIYATNFVFKFIETETRAGERYLADTGRVLFQDVLKAERDDGRRILFEHGDAIAFVPYFARYAYEVYVAPTRTHASLATLSDQERADLAAVLRDVVIRFDNLWKMPFPYVMALHQAPTDGAAYPGFHFHIEFHPPLRKPNLLKYLAGPEIGGGNFLSDTAPEAKAGGAQGRRRARTTGSDHTRTITMPRRREGTMALGCIHFLRRSRRCIDGFATRSWRRPSAPRSRRGRTCMPTTRATRSTPSTRWPKTCWSRRSTAPSRASTARSCWSPRDLPAAASCCRVARRRPMPAGRSSWIRSTARAG